MDINTGNQLKGYISREVKQTPMHSNYGYNYYFCRSLLDRIYKEIPETFILKGSFSQYSNLKSFTRPFTDIDIVTYKKIDVAKDELENLLNSSSEIEYTIKQRFITTKATINYRLLCRFDQITHLIELDVRKEHEQNDIVKNDLPLLFSKDKDIEVSTISLEDHLANKLYITLLNLELYEKVGKQFRRFKDFYDIYNILGKGDIDSYIVAEKLKDRIKNDEFLSQYNLSGSLFDKSFVDENSNLYNVDAKKYEFDKNIKLETTTEVVNDYISKIR